MRKFDIARKMQGATFESRSSEEQDLLEYHHCKTRGVEGPMTVTSDPRTYGRMKWA